MIRLYSLILTTILALPGWGVASLRQNPPAQQSNSQETQQAAKPQPYPSTEDLVNIDVMVTDDKGRILGGLKPGNFRILDDKQPRNIKYFAPPSSPMTVVILMEYSASSYQYYAGKSAYWAERFVDQLEPEDWVALMTYDLRPHVVVDFTHNNYAIREGIARLGFPAFRETNLYDSLIDVLERLRTVRGRKAVVVVGTGMNSFSAATFDDVRREARKTDAIVFCVGTAEQEVVRSRGSTAAYSMVKNQMSAIAKQTGGIAYFPRFEGALPDIFSSIAAFLRHAYTLGFEVPENSRDGRYHRLKVEVVGPEGKPLRVTDKEGKTRKVEVMTRQGYTAPKPKTAVSGKQPGGN